MDSTKAAQQFREAEERYSARQFPEALELLDELSRAIPLHEAVEFARAQTLVMMGRTADAQAVCENLLPLFGADGVAELNKVLRDLQESGDEELEWGFLRPTEDPVSFDMLDSATESKPTSSITDDIESFFADLDVSDVEGLDEVEVISAPAPQAEEPQQAIPVPAPEPEPPAEEPKAENELLSAFDAVLEPADAESTPEPEDQEPEPESAFSGDINPLGSLGAMDDDEPSFVEESPEPAPAPPPVPASELDELGPLGSLDDDLPEPEPEASPIPQSDFGDLGELGSLDDIDEPEPVQPAVNLPPVDDLSSDIELGGLSDFGSDDSEPEDQAEAQPPSSVWDEPAAVSAAEAPPVAPTEFEPAPLNLDSDGDLPAVAPILDDSTPPPPLAFGSDGDVPAVPPIFDEPAPSPPASSRVERPQRRSRRGVVLLMLLLVAAGGGGAWYYLNVIQSGSPEASAPAEPATSTAAAPAPAAAPAAPELDAAEFSEMLASLAPDGDPGPIMNKLRSVANLSAWPRQDQPALSLVVRASGERGGGAMSTAFTTLATSLIEAGADPAFVDRRGQSLVEMAAQSNDEPMVRLLVDRGGPVSPRVLVWAVRSGRLPLVQQFLSSHPDAANAEVLYAAIDSRHEAIADLLLKHGVPLDSVVELAVQRGTRHVFRYAVDGGVDIGARPELLPLAIESQQPAMVGLLLQAGIDPRPAATALEAKEQKTAEDQEILRLIREQLAVRPAAPNASTAAVPAATSAAEVGTLYARAKQGEHEWAVVGPWRGGIPAGSDRVYRVVIDADRPDDLAPLAKLRPGDLYALRLQGPGVTDDALAYVGTLSGLRELELIGARVTDAGLQRLSQLTLLTSLRVTSPPNAPRAQINGPGLTILRPMLHLATLDLSGTTFGDRALPLLDGLTGLKALNIAGTDITDASLGSLRNLRNLSVLAFGTGPGMSSRITGSALYAIRDLENLCELHLYGVPMSKIGFEALTSLRRLQYVDLRATGITADNLPQLAELKHIGTIRLGENDLDQQARTNLQKQLTGSTLDFGA